MRTLAGVDDADGELGPDHGAFDECRVTVREARHHCTREMRGAGHVADTEGGSAPRRLDDQREPEPTDDRVEHPAGPELAEQALGERHELRGREPGTLDDSLGDRLAPGDPALPWPGPERAQTEQLKDVADRPVLSARTVQEGPDEVGPGLRERGDEVGVDIVDADLETDGAQRLSDPPAGSQGHVTLVGEPAGEDDDARRCRS